MQRSKGRAYGYLFKTVFIDEHCTDRVRKVRILVRCTREMSIDLVKEVFLSQSSQDPLLGFLSTSFMLSIL